MPPECFTSRLAGLRHGRARFPFKTFFVYVSFFHSSKAIISSPLPPSLPPLPPRDKVIVTLAYEKDKNTDSVPGGYYGIHSKEWTLQQGREGGREGRSRGGNVYWDVSFYSSRHSFSLPLLPHLPPSLPFLPPSLLLDRCQSVGRACLCLAGSALQALPCPRCLLLLRLRRLALPNQNRTQRLPWRGQGRRSMVPPSLPPSLPPSFLPSLFPLHSIVLHALIPLPPPLPPLPQEPNRARIPALHPLPLPLRRPHPRATPPPLLLPAPQPPPRLPPGRLCPLLLWRTLVQGDAPPCLRLPDQE